MIEAQQPNGAGMPCLLIGSADGKVPYSRASEMMVGHANRQPQKMTDRYLPVRDTAQPLNSP